MARPIVEHIIDGMQICRRCDVNKSIDQFWKNNTKASGFVQYCKLCSNLNRKESRNRTKNGTIKHSFKFTEKDKGTSEYKNHQRNKHIQKTYGIDLEEYNNMFSNQNGCCKICKVHQTELNRPLDIDHDHKTGNIRGLLCIKCNTGIGLFNDSIEVLSSVIKYLEDNNKNNSLEFGNINSN